MTSKKGSGMPLGAVVGALAAPGLLSGLVGYLSGPAPWAPWVQAVAAGAGAGIAGWVLWRGQVSAPVQALFRTMEQTRLDGDLSRRAPELQNSPLAPLAGAFNGLVESVQGIIGKVIFNSQEVAAASNHLMGHAREVGAGSDEQRGAAQATSGAMEEMAQGMREVERHARLTAQNAQEAQALSAHGEGIAMRASEEIGNIARCVAQSAQVVEALGERSSQISGIVQVIHEIADQTNLLALNAAIEAARAGEQGRGFAVVADEVRKLAERTAVATREISSLIQAIQDETSTAIGNIRQSSQQAQEGAQLAMEAAESLQSINKGAQATMESVDSIAAAISEQSREGETISGHVRQILDMAARNSGSTQRTVGEADRLAHLAANLKEIGNVFRLGADGERALNVHSAMPALVQQAAADIGRVLEQAVERGEISEADLFDRSYKPIANTRPQKYSTRFDSFTDRHFPGLQEPILERHSHVVYAGAVDDRGYFPTHNRRFSQPLTGDFDKDFIGNRTKRIFDDPVGKRCGSHDLPFLLQTYRRDTREIMHDISAPIYVKGRHWGGFRIGYRA